MKINILTIFPEIFEGWKQTGMIGKAVEEKRVEINIIDFRLYADNKHSKVDDYPYGGSQGMLLMVQPLDDAIIKNNLDKTHVIFPSPKGKTLNQKKLEELSMLEEITLVAGRYEGVDQRFIDMHVDEEISIGDYIITGGELSICVILDGVIRLLPEVLGNKLSFIDESFSDDLLEEPQYTRPASYKGLDVPEVLLSGHHENIKKWRIDKRKEITKQVRPDLIRGDKNDK